MLFRSMHVFGVGPGREVGTIKVAIREAILEGDIPNEFEAAYEFMLKKGRELGLEQKHSVVSSESKKE